MITEVHEPVKVGAVFSGGTVTIRWIIWKGKKILIERVTFAWKTADGAKEVRKFALSNGTEVFEVSFYPADCRWYLEKIHGE